MSYIFLYNHIVTNAKKITVSVIYRMDLNQICNRVSFISFQLLRNYEYGQLPESVVIGEMLKDSLKPTLDYLSAYNGLIKRDELENIKLKVDSIIFSLRDLLLDMLDKYEAEHNKAEKENDEQKIKKALDNRMKAMQIYNNYDASFYAIIRKVENVRIKPE